MGSEVTDLKKSSWVSHLENEVGCSPKLAISALNIWLNAFKKDSFTEIELDDDIFEQALEFYDNGQHEKAVDLFSLLAEQGHIEAQYFLASCYENGQGGPVDEKEAVKWYRKAAEQRNSPAQWSLGICYEYGKGVQVDQEEAVKWYRKAAEQGDASAQWALGRCYKDGKGVPVDEKEAAKWYRKAAEQGDADAQYCLAQCYEAGYGGEKNNIEALKWYKKAAENGSEEAKDHLFSQIESLKEEGMAHYNKNEFEEAVKLFLEAAEGGNAFAQKMLGICYFNGRG